MRWPQAVLILPFLALGACDSTERVLVQPASDASEHPGRALRREGDDGGPGARDPERRRRPGHNQPFYAPGEIVVGLYDWVTLEQADAMVRSHDLSWEPRFPYGFTYWVRAVEGDPSQYIPLLERSNIVAWAKVRGGPSGANIIITFNGRATEEAARMLIASIPVLEIVEKIVGPKWGVVFVPDGRELQWIEVLRKEPIVRYAELNTIIRIGALSLPDQEDISSRRRSFSSSPAFTAGHSESMTL